MEKPRVRVKLHNFANFVYVLGRGVPDDAQPGDLVVGNRGAAARVTADSRLRCLTLEYVGNIYFGAHGAPGARVYDFSGGTRP